MSDLLKISKYGLSLKCGDSRYKVLSDIEMSVKEGQIIGLIGESGSGKSVLWKSVMGLLDEKNWEISKDAKVHVRQRPSVILQDPMNAFDQVFTIKYHFLETSKAASKQEKKEVLNRAKFLMEQLYIRDPEKVLDMYPFQCSGGMLQRIMIAIALMDDCKMLVADEPTTSVDVTVQREIVALLKEINEKKHTGILYISHDLEIMENIADRIYVMYAGYLVEEFPASKLKSQEVLHPYTVQLLKSRPTFSKEPLYTMVGNPPTLMERQSGCPFAPRCGYKTGKCLEFDMKNHELSENHRIRCCRWEDFV